MRHKSLRVIIDRIPQRYQRRFRDLLDIPEDDVYIEFHDGRIARLNDPFLHSYGSTINKNQGSSAEVVALFNPDYKTSQFMRNFFSYRHLYTCVSRPVMEFWYCGNGPDEFYAMIMLDPPPSLSCLSNIFTKHLADCLQNRAQSKVHIPMFKAQPATAAATTTSGPDGTGAPVRSKFLSGAGSSAHDLWLKLQQNQTKVKRVDYVPDKVVSTDEDDSSDSDGNSSDDSDSDSDESDDDAATKSHKNNDKPSSKPMSQKKQPKYKRKGHPSAGDSPKSAADEDDEKSNNKRQKVDGSKKKTRHVYNNKRVNNNSSHVAASAGQASITSFFTAKLPNPPVLSAAAASTVTPQHELAHTDGMADAQATDASSSVTPQTSFSNAEPTSMDIE
jgi:hypothetical protein